MLATSTLSCKNGVVLRAVWKLALFLRELAAVRRGNLSSWQDCRTLSDSVSPLTLMNVTREREMQKAVVIPFPPLNIANFKEVIEVTSARLKYNSLFCAFT